jgi:hypothetical protein
MNMSRWLQRSLTLAAIMLVGAAPLLLAQREQVFDWSGRVDREVQLTMRGNDLSLRSIGDVSRTNSRVMRPLPRMDGQLVVQVLNGRGRADVIQQPSARNGYTAIVRLQDTQSGSDNYRIAGYWQSFNAGRPGVDRGVDRGADRGADRGEDRGADRGRDMGRGNGRGMNDQTLLHWSGNVDGELEIQIRNGRVSYRQISGGEPTGVRANEGRGVNRNAGLVNIAQSQGRGTVRVVQQPSNRNGYTTIIRVNDPRGGYGYYDFDVFWR